MLRLFSFCWILLGSGTVLAEPSGHGKDTIPDIKTRHAHSPLPNPLPLAGEGANESVRNLHSSSQPLRLGITPAAARNQYALLEEWRAYLEQKLNRPVELISRDSSLDTVELLKQNKLDFAWLSAPVYLRNRQRMNLVAAPVYRGRPLDQTYLIVPSSDQSTQSILQLQGKVFAFVEPDSNSGYLEPIYQLIQAKKDPDQFFQKTFFTRDHQKIVAAVAIGLADGGSMSGFAWESLALSRPDITSQTRIVTKSAQYGFPPIIARSNLNKDNFTRMQKVLLDMANDANGLKLLNQLNLDGFVLIDDKLYRSVQLMISSLGDQ